jgi:hypothetical protein
VGAAALKVLDAQRASIMMHHGAASSNSSLGTEAFIKGPVGRLVAPTCALDLSACGSLMSRNRIELSRPLAGPGRQAEPSSQ